MLNKPKDLTPREHDLFSTVFSTLVAISADVLEHKEAGGSEDDFHLSDGAFATIGDICLQSACEFFQASPKEVMDVVYFAAKIALQMKEVVQKAKADPQAATRRIIQDEMQPPSEEVAAKIKEMVDAAVDEADDDDLPF